MPRKAEIPEHWKKGAEQPEWMGEADDYPSDEELYAEEAIEMEEPSDFVLGDDKSPDEMVNGNELLNLKTELKEREEEERKKQEIKDVKRKIRRIKYKPVFDVGASLKEGVADTAGKLRAMRGTPEQREYRKQKFRGAIQRIAKGTTGAIDRLGGFGDRGGGRETIVYYGDEAIEVEKPRQKAKPQFTENIFGVGGGTGGMNLLGEETKQKPRILDIGTGGGMMGGGMNLFGGETKHTPKIMSGGMDMGFSGMGMNLLGTPAPRRKTARRTAKRKTTKKRKSSKKKGKKRKSTKKRTPKKPMNTMGWI